MENVSDFLPSNKIMTTIYPSYLIKNINIITIIATIIAAMKYDTIIFLLISRYFFFNEFLHCSFLACISYKFYYFPIPFIE